MIIHKKPIRPEIGYRRLVPFRAARNGFRAFIEASGVAEHGRVLLPAYIGWSSREGSGVFDPIIETAVEYSFYPVGEDLSIDLGAVADLLEIDVPCLLVVIHYFGYPSEGSAQAARLVRERGGMVLEDQAHSLLSDWIGGVTGNLGDASIYSFHKLFPADWGGGLALGTGVAAGLSDTLAAWPTRSEMPLNPLSYDLKAISEARRKNALELARLLEPLATHLRPVWPVLPRGVVPQTFPVRVLRGSRDDLYEEMNEAGFGVVSLYHTMVDTIDRRTFPVSYDLAKTMLNLPCHQDVPPGGLKAMVDRLAVWAERT